MSVDLCLFLFAGFLVKHFLCDFVLQNYWMIEDKGHYGKIGGIMHALVHSVGTFLLLIFLLDPFKILIATIFDGVIHYHIDYLKSRLSHNLKSNDQLFWIYLGADQLLHNLCYVLIVAFVIYF